MCFLVVVTQDPYIDTYLLSSCLLEEPEIKMAL